MEILTYSQKVLLKRLNWSIVKLSCKTLFGLLILYLFQFYTLKKGGNVQNKKDGRKL